MTNVQAALAATTIASLMVGGFGYTTKVKKPTEPVTYYYRGPAAPAGTSILRENEVRKVTNWSTTSQLNNPGTSLHSITFNQESENESNGIADGKYSLQEAIDALWFEYARSGCTTRGHCFTPAVSGASLICIKEIVQTE